MCPAKEPLDSVGEHADVPLTRLLDTGLQVRPQLLQTRCVGLSDTEVVLQLEENATTLDIDPPSRAVSGPSLQANNVIVVKTQVG